MKIEFKTVGSTVTFDISDELNINELMEEIRNVLLAMTYQPESIQEGFEYMLQEYGKKDREWTTDDSI